MLVRLAWSALSSLRTAPTPAPWRSAYSTASKKSDPLRILFCGSDEFSCHSLQALHHEHKRNARLIRSIDVVVRPAKRMGRGNKVLREVPVRQLAERLNLPIHVRDTFTGWDMPQPDGHPINLIIAVSFGLFVPPRLIHASQYGGLNVHPSLLPDFRGPAPLHHALLSNRSHTGITIQTLSPHAFDEGIPLLQTPAPGIPIPADCTLPQLHALLAPAGATMLVQALRRGLHVPPHEPFEGCKQYPYPPRGSTATTGVPDAPKITTADREVRWDVSSAGEVVRQSRVLGPLWTRMSPPASGSGVPRRVILDEVSEVSAEEVGDRGIRGAEQVRWVIKGKEGAADAPVLNNEVPAEIWEDKEGGGVLVCMRDGSWLRVGKIKLEGWTLKPAWRVLRDYLARTAKVMEKEDGQ